MAKTKVIAQKIQLILAIALTVFNLKQAQALPKFSGTEKTLVFAAPPPPPDIGEPGQRSHAGSRGCEKDNEGQATSNREKRLTALVPAYQSPNSELVWGLTTSDRPTFWFYVPYQLTSKHSIEFVLKDDRDNYLYKIKSSGKGTLPGIVNLRLPSTVSLESDRNYAWYFLIYCQSPTPASYINGLIRRVQRPNLKNQLKSATPQERAILYAEQGIWYDALTELAQLRRTHTENDKFNRDWTSLLQSVGLKRFAEKPLISCCSVED
jgi:Domain of Unknown Function (DUF928)